MTVAAPAAPAPASGRRWRGRLRPAALETVLVVSALLGIAAAARWPNLWLVPTFTDETGEVKLAYEVARGAVAPLTNVDPYIGALWNWMLAIGFWTFGLNPWLPRLLVFLGGVLTVGAVWWLGRVVGDRADRSDGRLAGIVAALFMAGCSTHILVNSHVAWSHAMTPLWTTLGLASLMLALRLGGGGASWLVPAGFFLGLGVQTHITAVLLLPGAALALLVGRPGLVRTRWLVFGALAFMLATSNLLVYNALTGGETLRGGQAKLAGYTGQDEGGLDTDNYSENVGRLTLATSWVLSGAIEKRRFVGETLADPLLLGYLGLAAGSVLWAARRGVWLPLLVAAPYLLMLPLLQGKFEPMLNGRYVMPALPLVFASIGLVVTDLTRLFRARWPARAALLGGALVGLAALIALYPLAPLAVYQRSARSNHAILAAHEAVMIGRTAPDEVVLVDYGLDSVFFMAAGSAFKSMELLLGGSDVPYTVIDARAASLEDELSGHESRLLVLNTEKVKSLSRDFTLTALMGGERDNPGFGVFRVTPLP